MDEQEYDEDEQEYDEDEWEYDVDSLWDHESFSRLAGKVKEKLNERAANGWELVSTPSYGYDGTFCIFLVWRRIVS
jgi:hypothetical protein